MATPSGRCCARKIKELKTFEDAVKAFSDMCDGVLIDKQRDYGPRNITDFGLLGILIRINDKVQRIRNLESTLEDPVNESIKDSWLDIRNYAQIALMLMDGKFELPLKEKSKEITPKEYLDKEGFFCYTGDKGRSFTITEPFEKLDEAVQKVYIERCGGNIKFKTFYT